MEEEESDRLRLQNEVYAERIVQLQHLVNERKEEIEGIQKRIAALEGEDLIQVVHEAFNATLDVVRRKEQQSREGENVLVQAGADLDTISHSLSDIGGLSASMGSISFQKGKDIEEIEMLGELVGDIAKLKKTLLDVHRAAWAKSDDEQGNFIGDNFAGSSHSTPLKVSRKGDRRRSFDLEMSKFDEDFQVSETKLLRSKFDFSFYSKCVTLLRKHSFEKLCNDTTPADFARMEQKLAELQEQSQDLIMKQLAHRIQNFKISLQSTKLEKLEVEKQIVSKRKQTATDIHNSVTKMYSKLLFLHLSLFENSQFNQERNQLVKTIIEQFESIVNSQKENEAEPSASLDSSLSFHTQGNVRKIDDTARVIEDLLGEEIVFTEREKKIDKL
jgi:hypothetical protein